MGAPGFWDEPESAARTSAEHARVTRKLSAYTELTADTDDLAGLEAYLDKDLARPAPRPGEEEEGPAEA